MHPRLIIQVATSDLDALEIIIFQQLLPWGIFLKSSYLNFHTAVTKL